MTNTNKPEKRFSAGAISATIWNNTIEKDGKETNYKTISFDRKYKDKEDNWKSTNSLRASDIPKAILVLNKAYEYLTLRSMDSSSPDIKEFSFDEEAIIF